MTQYSTAIFMRNPEGSYDPAPLHEFELVDSDHPPSITVGDILSTTYRIGEGPMRTYYYRVVDRTFRFDVGEIRVFILVEEIEENWTAKFNS